MSEGKGESGTNNLLESNKYEQICNDCLCGIVELKMYFKVRGLEFKSR